MIFKLEDQKDVLNPTTVQKIYTTPFKSDAFLFHRSFYNTYLRLNDEEASAYIKAILAYAFEGKVPDENDPVWIRGLEVSFFQMDIDAGRKQL